MKTFGALLVRPVTEADVPRVVELVRVVLAEFGLVRLSVEAASDLVEDRLWKHVSVREGEPIDRVFGNGVPVDQRVKYIVVDLERKHCADDLDVAA